MAKLCSHSDFSVRKQPVLYTDPLQSIMPFTAAKLYGMLWQINLQETWRRPLSPFLEMKNRRKSTFLTFRGLPRKFMIIAGGFCISLDVIQFRIFQLVSSLKTGLEPLMCKLLSSRNSYPKWKTPSSAKSAWTRRLTQCFVHVDTWFPAVSVRQALTCVLFAEGRLNVLNMFSSQLQLVELVGDTWTSGSEILHSVVFKVLYPDNIQL